MTEPRSVTTASSDGDLISAVRSGDSEAYGILYERHAAAARRMARQAGQNEADADDIVAETFARVLAAIRRGTGPSEAFRPYLLTAARRVAADHMRGQRSQVPTEHRDLPDQGEVAPDPAEAAAERSLVARAFASLPERWSAVLWQTEIEQARPAEVALLLGISPNGVAALRYRAREGLRQAYLQMHLSERTRPECAPFAAKLGGYVRGALSRRDARQLRLHLAGCADCRHAQAELAAISSAMRGVLAPVILGSQAAAYLAHRSHAAHAAAGLRGGALHVLRALPSDRRIGPAAATAVAAAVAVPVVMALAPHAPPPRLPGRLAGPAPALAAPATGSGGHHRGSQVPGHAGAPGSGLTAPPGGRHAPSPTGSRSPRPSPAPSSPARSRTPAPAPSPSPARTTTAASVTAKLSVGVSVSGLLNLGVTDVVTVVVSDPGTGATGPVTASVALPAGVSLVGPGPASSGWSCSGVTCTHGPVAAGASASVSFRVLVVTLAGCGKPISATASSGTLSAAGRSAATVACSGL